LQDGFLLHLRLVSRGPGDPEVRCTTTCSFCVALDCDAVQLLQRVGWHKCGVGRVSITNIDGVYDTFLEARENALDEESSWLWFQNRELVLQQKQASKKAGSFFGLQVRPGASWLRTARRLSSESWQLARPSLTRARSLLLGLLEDIMVCNDAFCKICFS
jgi:hypothetical protein